MTTTTDSTTAASGPGRQAVGKQAAATATARNSVHVEVPGVGHVHLPPLDQLAFLGGIATLAVIQIIEWPVAVALTVGHILTHNRHNALLRDYGEALDKA